MDWSDVGKTILSFAPEIGGALLGPAGALAGTAISKVLGTTDTPASVHKQIQDNPAAKQAVINYSQSHRVALTALANLGETDEEVKKTRAIDPRLFIAGAQPFVVWSCGAGLLYSVVLAPIANGFGAHFASANLPEIAAMLTMLLGHGAQKTLEKFLNK